MSDFLLSIPDNASIDERERLGKLNNEFRKEAYWRKIDGWLLVLMLLLIVTSVAILGLDKTQNSKLVEWVEKYFYPLITLIFGYITGKTVKGVRAPSPNKTGN